MDFHGSVNRGVVAFEILGQWRIERTELYQWITERVAA
jgi:hypothetical protein